MDENREDTITCTCVVNLEKDYFSDENLKKAQASSKEERKYQHNKAPCAAEHASEPNDILLSN